MFAYIKNSYGRASSEEIAALESTLGVRLPEDYKSFLCETGGGSLVGNSVEPIKPIDIHFEVCDFNSVEAHEGVLFSDLESMQDTYEGAVPSDLFVVGSDWGGNLYTILLAHPHTVFWWDHETGERFEVAENFADLLARIKPTPKDPPECDFSIWDSLPTDWRSKYSLTVCECAAKSGRADIVEQWAALGRPLGDSMRLAAMNGNLDVVDLLISLGVDINRVCPDGRTPLDWASWIEDQVPPLRERGFLSVSELPG